MAIRGLKKWALLLTFWVALQSRWVRATDLTGGNLTLTGTADIQGNTISLGTGASSYPGWQGAYTDGTTSYVDLTGTRSANIWRWWQNGSGTPQLQLTLDNNNKLTLYDQSSTPVAKITLDPLGTSTFTNSVTVTGSLTVNGTNNQMPNQTLTGAHSVLTEGLADSRYVSNSGSSITTGSASSYGYWGFSLTGPTMSVNWGTASGPFSFAEGNNTNASGAVSVAIGCYATASGLYSAAMGFATTSSGSISMAMGGFSSASGSYSTAMGSHTSASGNYSTALGIQTSAIGPFSTAMGYQTVANSSASTAMGEWSQANGPVSTAMGLFSNAGGNYSTAMGEGTAASGSVSTAIGYFSTASAYYSTAMGCYSTAAGKFSTASGNYTTAQAIDSFVVGVRNTGHNASGGTASPTSWVPTDPLFEIGNGRSPYGGGNPAVSGPSDALVVYKNGNATLQGTFTTTTVITTTAAGDIPMFGH